MASIARSRRGRRTVYSLVLFCGVGMRCQLLPAASTVPGAISTSRDERACSLDRRVMIEKMLVTRFSVLPGP